MSTDLRALLGDRHDQVIESAARAHAGIEPGDDWPTNAALDCGSALVQGWQEAADIARGEV